MALINRRNFLMAAGLGTLAAATGFRPALASAPAVTAQGARVYSGANLAGWETIVGDAIHPGQPAVQAADVASLHYAEHSEVRANVNSRPDIMAHNLTLRRYADPLANQYLHHGRYAFRLPYWPTTSNRALNGQTVEGALAVWDGQTTQRLRSVAFQWIVNPHWMEGTLQVWTSAGWQPAGFLPIDLEWHTVEMTLDPRSETCALRIDGVALAAPCVVEAKPAFGVDVAATLAAESISIDPGNAFSGGMQHVVEFKDWAWVWEPAHIRSTYMPLVAR